MPSLHRPEVISAGWQGTFCTWSGRNWISCPPFRCEVDFVGDNSAVIVILDEFDMENAPRLRDVLDALSDLGIRDRVVVDLSDCTFIDSTGLGFLVVAQKMVGPALHVVASNDAIRRVLSITGLKAVFVVHRTRDDAVAALQQEFGGL